MLKDHQIVVVTGIDSDGGLLKHIVELLQGSEHFVEIIDKSYGYTDMDAIAKCDPIMGVDLQFKDGGIWHNAMPRLFEFWA